MLNIAKVLRVFSLFLFSSLVFSLQASVKASEVTSQAHSTARLVTEGSNWSPGVNWLGLHIKLEEHWHTYWKNPGDSASAPFFNLKLPTGMSLNKIHYPRPQRIPFGPLESFGYEKEVLYLFEVSVSKDLKSGDFYSVSLESEWVVCREECVPGVFTFKIEQQFSEQSKIGKYGPIFDRFRKQLPEAIEELGSLDFESNQFATLYLPEEVSFPILDVFPLHNRRVTNHTPQISDREVRFQVVESPDLSGSVESFLLLGQNQSAILNAKLKEESLLLMILFAFLGGLLLNLMPCVFPVLGLKLYSVVHQREQNSHHIIFSNLIYTFGVLVSFWLLALVISLLRVGGESLGWGFHLQSPVFVFILMILFFVMALLFLDLVPVSWTQFSSMGDDLTHKKGYRGSFFTGVLAVVVASPCTAPFMGAAMGYALSQSYFSIFWIFSALGIGLAFPFLIISIFPRLVRFLPKPGNWMVTFKKIMAVPLFLTVIWLFWVWIQLLGGGAQNLDNSMWQKFTRERLEEHLEKKDSVFVNFTASWCISCQVNERLVFQTDEIKAYFKENNFVLLKADWTKRDNIIGAELKRHGRAGVPLYLYYPSGTNTPLILPEVLTPSILLENLRSQNKGKGSSE